MPSKIQLDENLRFLFICLQKSDYKTIDFNAVAQATNLKSPAARMRYTRLRRQIEGGDLTGTRGAPFLAASIKISHDIHDMRKSQRYSKSMLSNVKCDVELLKKTSVDRKIKYEPQGLLERNETDSSECGDSEDEVPLAKRRCTQTKICDVALEGSSFVARNQEFLSRFIG